MTAKETTSCCISSSCISVPGHTAALKLLASSSDSLQEFLNSSSPSITPKHASTADSLTKSSTAVQQQGKVDVFAPRTPPLSPKLPAALPAKKAAGKSELATAAAPELEGYRQVFQGKRVLIISGGTRGDVQPATALGVALAGLGARVCIAADAMFGAFVQQHSLAYYQLAGDARGMMALTVKWGGMLPTELSGMSWLRSQIADVMDSVAAAAESWQPDIILANQLAYGQVHVAEKLQVPLHILLTIPWLPTTTIAHPWARAWGANITEYINAAAEALTRPGFALLSMLAPEMSRRWKGAALARVAAAANWLSTPLLDHTAWWGIADLMISFRRRLGLPLLSANNTGVALYRLPTTCLFSTALVPRPPDWDSNVTLAGFLSLSDAVTRIGTAAAAAAAGSDSSIAAGDSEDSSSGSDSEAESWASQLSDQKTNSSSSSSSSSWQASEELLQFLDEGSPPIYVGFGSMVVQDPQQLVQLVLQAASALPAGQRVILCTGWSGAAGAAAGVASGSDIAVGADGWGSSSSSSSSSVLCIREAPHEWLFPRCSALVHHGGVGTTAAGLRCGKPTMVVPAFGDLFFFADMCHQLGVGPAPIPLPELTAERLLAALQQLVVEQGQYSAAAAEVASKLRNEDGLAAAVASVACTLGSAR